MNMPTGAGCAAPPGGGRWRRKRGGEESAVRDVRVASHKLRAKGGEFMFVPLHDCRAVYPHRIVPGRQDAGQTGRCARGYAS